jgi:lipid-binding SYLF domain-containing protein
MISALAISLVLVGSPSSALPPSNARTLENAAHVLEALTEIPARGIPTRLLASAEGVAIIPRVIKAGFLFGGRGGHGVVLVRDKSGQWGDPVFINLGGASVGFQVGVESTDLVLVFRNRRSLDRFLEDKGKLTLGADASVAAGPVGRNAETATDGRLEAEILSYSRGRGVFAGVAIDGGVIRPDRESNGKFRQAEPNSMERKLAQELKAHLTTLSPERSRTPPPPVLGAPVQPVPPLPPGPRERP